MVLLSRSFVRKRLISLATTAWIAATSFALAEDPTKTDYARGAMLIHHVANRPDSSQEQRFLPENGGTMNRLMADITGKSTGDADRDPNPMIVPHRKSAIDMGKGWPAREIVAAQQQRIVPMRKVVGEGHRPRRSPRSNLGRKWRRNGTGLLTRAPVAVRTCLNSRAPRPLSQAALQG
jgi:hypothetical protein